MLSTDIGAVALADFAWWSSICFLSFSVFAAVSFADDDLPEGADASFDDESFADDGIDASEDFEE